MGAAGLTASSVGAGTRTGMQRLRTGSMTRQAELHERIRRQPALYFSIVRRSAACALVESRSTSFSTTTAQI